MRCDFVLQWRAARLSPEVVAQAVLPASAGGRKERDEGEQKELLLQCEPPCSETASLHYQNRPNEAFYLWRRT
jgi:hypothetical protein